MAQNQPKVALEARGWTGCGHSKGGRRRGKRKWRPWSAVLFLVGCSWKMAGLTLQPGAQHFYMRAGTRLKTRPQGPYSACKGSCCAGGPTFGDTSLCVCQKLGSPAQ